MTDAPKSAAPGDGVAVTRSQLIRRILWPEKFSLFAIVGAAAGLLTDFVAFLADHVTPMWPLLAFAVVSAGAAVYCFRKALQLPEPIAEEAARNVSGCPQCDAFRFAAFSVLAFGLVLSLGQGATLTEQVGTRLGLIERKIDAMSAKVDTMSTQMDDFASIAQPQMLIEDPRVPAEHFSNAWLHLNVRRDPASAWQSIQAVYAGKAPVKLDAAEMYFAVGRNFVARQQLSEDLRRLGTEKGDATLLVVAGRNAGDPDRADALYAEAQQLDPELPFAHWDMQRPELRPATMVVGAAAQQQQAAAARRKVERLEKFLALAATRPVGSYFYLPQYQGDFEQIAQQHLQINRSMQGVLEADYDAIAREEFERRQKEKR